jgi:flagellar basal body P-ring protein FlgI
MAEDLKETIEEEQLQRFNFQQLRQMLQNANIKVTKGAIQSSNYVSATSGWILRGDGTYEFN